MKTGFLEGTDEETGAEGWEDVATLNDNDAAENAKENEANDWCWGADVHGGAYMGACVGVGVAVGAAPDVDIDIDIEVKVDCENCDSGPN